MLHEPREKSVAGTHVTDPGEAQLLDQAVLQRAVGALYAALCLTGVRAHDLDVEFCKRAAELRHTRAALRVWLVHAEDGVLVGVESGRASMRRQIAVERSKVGVRALAGNEPQLHQPAGGVVDEDQQGKGLAALFEPAMLRAVDLNQLTVALPPQPRLLERPPLLARQPQPVGNHPPPQRLPANLDAVLLKQDLCGKRRPEVRVPGLHQLDHVLANSDDQLVVGVLTPSLVDQRTATAIPVSPH